MPSSKWLLILCLAVWSRFGGANDDDSTCEASPPHTTEVPSDCRLVMAPSAIPGGGWGIFTLVERRKGTVLHPSGDLAIQLNDLVDPEKAIGMRQLLHEYLWDSHETGGFYEGQHVMSMIPGPGMLANGMSTAFNVLPYVPRVDEAGLTRAGSPGAGAITHYHNLTFWFARDVAAGGEVLLHYGPGWFQERAGKVLEVSPDEPILKRDPQWLRENGYCLDNLESHRSKILDAGRGAFAGRDLMEGSVVTPVPVMPIASVDSLLLTLPKLDGSFSHGRQLLLNYCWGHENSTLLLYPYSNHVNLINHSPNPNVGLRWLAGTTFPSLDTMQVDQPHGLLLELVALRDIRRGEEIVMDYGTSWSEAWEKHVNDWTPPPGAERYAPSYVHDDAIQSLRLEKELKTHPYPDNIFTSCFYKYNATEDKRTSSERNSVTTVPWQMSRGLFELSNLRPCLVLERQHDTKKGTTFTVQIKNRFGLSPEQRVSGAHIVTEVPRRAIRFSDKIYTTDQHLPGAFRHPIGIPYDVFPEEWMDLST